MSNYQDLIDPFIGVMGTSFCAAVALLFPTSTKDLNIFLMHDVPNVTVFEINI